MAMTLNHLSSMRRLVVSPRQTHALYERDGEFNRTMCGQFIRGGEVAHKVPIKCRACLEHMHKAKMLISADAEPREPKQMPSPSRTEKRR